MKYKIMKYLKKYKRIVIKIGSSILVNEEKNKIKINWLNSLCKDIHMLQNQGKEIAIVSSGAIALGKKKLNLNKKLIKLEDKQAAAAIGQIELINNWQKALKKYKTKGAQLLLTLNDSEERRRYLNARNTINSLLNKNVIPIVNENDTVATEEIRFGDNDRLAARVAQMMSAELLIILSETDGIYEKNPKLNQNVKKIITIKSINKKIESVATNETSNLGSGGMKTKIWAAKICMSSGCSMVVASGLEQNALQKINKQNSSWFLALKNPRSARKQWIVNHLNTVGEIKIDDGAVKAIRKNKSLLPAGIIKIKGNFSRGDAVEICDKHGKKIAIGLSSYDNNDILKIMGKKSHKIKEILGYSGRDECVHKDDLVIK